MTHLKKLIEEAKKLEQPETDRIGPPFILIRNWKTEKPGRQGFKTIEAFEKALSKRDVGGKEITLNGYGQVTINFNPKN